jgi:DNA-binding transcriptional MerR regulator
MPYNPNKELKKFYSISEVAAKFGVAESLLRYWEKEFPNIKPKKTESRGVRKYTAEDIEEIGIVHNLLKVRGMKISAARQVLEKNREGANNTAEVLRRLQSLRDELVEISNELKDL